MEKKENHSYKKLYTGVINTLCITPVDKKANKLLKKEKCPKRLERLGQKVLSDFLPADDGSADGAGHLGTGMGVHRPVDIAFQCFAEHFEAGQAAAEE